MKTIHSLSLLMTMLIWSTASAPAVQSSTGGISGIVTYRDGQPTASLRVVAISAYWQLALNLIGRGRNDEPLRLLNRYLDLAQQGNHAAQARQLISELKLALEGAK